jgi:hypothetical protein
VLFNEIFLDCYDNETSNDFGSGISNTEILIENGCNSDIQFILDNYENSTGYSNWFIPSYAELYYLCNLGTINGSFSINTWMNTNLSYSFNGVSNNSFDQQPDDFLEIFNLGQIGNYDNYLTSNRHGSYITLNPTNCSDDGSVGNNNNNLLLFREF